MHWDVLKLCQKTLMNLSAGKQGRGIGEQRGRVALVAEEMAVVALQEAVVLEAAGWDPEAMAGAGEREAAALEGEAPGPHSLRRPAGLHHHQGRTPVPQGPCRQRRPPLRG